MSSHNDITTMKFSRRSVLIDGMAVLATARLGSSTTAKVEDLDS
jgi:hypothetical protein